MKQLVLVFLCLLGTISVKAQFSGAGSGTSSDPYQITNADELAEMAYFLGDSHKGTCFKLMNDIDLSQWIADNNPTQGWTPIGVNSDRFKGRMDGDGHTISGIYINRSNFANIGFFGYVENATISNLIVLGSSVTGGNSTGGLVGHAINSQIANCNVSLSSAGIVGTQNVGGLLGYGEGTTIQGCEYRGKVYASDNEVGGLIGRANSSNISDCSAYADVESAAHDNVGGIIGYTYYSLECTNCKHQGSIVGGNVNIGGVIGYVYPYERNATVSKCSHNGKIAGKNNVGGIVGRIYWYYNNYSFRILQCFANGDIEGQQCVGGILGQSEGISSNYGDVYINDCYANVNIVGIQFVGGILGRIYQTKGGNVRYCYMTGTIVGDDCVGGIVGNLDRYTISSNCVIASSISGTSNVGRVYGSRSGGTIGAVGSQQGNRAYAMCEMIINGRKESVLDDEKNGSAISLSALKGSAAFSGLGWDFTDTWTINNGKTFPYLKWEKRVSAIELNKTTANLTIGESTTIIASVTPTDADLKDLNWITSDESIVKVESDGTITAVAEGTASITATAKDGSEISATCIVIVSNNPDFNNIIYYTSSDGQVITPYKTDVFGASIISNTYENGQGMITFDGDVTSIGDNAFYRCFGLTSIAIPARVTSIGDYAFYYCSGLTSITIPESVTSIGDRAFYGCSGLTSIAIPASVTSIGGRAFYFCTGLTSITIPESVTNIGDYAFRGCTGLTNITIPERVTSIGSYAFRGCTGLASITIPKSVTSIGSYAFSDCSGLTSIFVDSNNPKYDSRNDCNAIIETSTNTLLGGCQNTIIPESVTSIGGYAFYGCSGLTSITIPESVTSIGDNAFRGCSGLTSITIPESVTSIENYAFEGCSGLTSITIPASVTSIGGSAFYSCTGLTSITIPESVTSIGNYAFYGCSGLTDVYVKRESPLSVTNMVFYNVDLSTVTLHVPYGTKEVYETADTWKDFGTIIEEYVDPNHVIYYTSSDGQIITPYKSDVFGANIISNTYENGQGMITFDGNVTRIGDYAFEGCSGLTSITIPESVTSIGTSAFYNCSRLTSITIPESVTSIGGIAFYRCSGLTSITIPESVTSIGGSAFSDCSGLTSITIPESVTSIGGSAFSGCTGLTSIIVDSGNPNYDSRNGCNAIIVTSTKKLLTGCQNTTIPESVTSIGGSAFCGCSSLTSITIPESVTSIGGSAFYGCSGLTSITLPESVTSIGNRAFEGCSGLTSITLPESVTSIGVLAFEGCSRLTSIIVDSGNPNYYSRNGCNAIIETSTNTLLWGCQNTTIPESVTSIGDYAFSGCFGLTSITIPASVTSIGVAAFDRCSSLTSITIPASVTSIGEEAFWNCSRLTSISIPESVTSIGTRAFCNCISLTDVYVEWESPLSVSNDVFSDVDHSTVTLHVPYGTKELYETADVWKDFGNIVYDPMMEMCYTSIDGNIVIPNDEEAFGVAILNNTYENGQGKIAFAVNITAIGKDAFAECSTLESIIIPDGVTSIGRYAFWYCEALASVSIPASVNTIDRYAFRDCDVLENVSNYALIPQTLNSNTFTHYGTLHVVDGYKEVYAAADYWKNFTIIDDLPDANAAYITDGTVYDNVEDSNPSKIVYTRTFSSADKWQALYVPFSIPVEVLTENGLEVAELNNIHMYDTDGDKQFDKTTLEFLYLTDGETEANYPYLIKADKVGELKLTLKDVELKAAADTQIECASTRKVFKIKGTYTGVSGADMYNNNYYAVGGGTLVKAASADNALKPQRWYMSIENKDGSPVDYFAPKMRIMINGMEIDEYEENETGIQEISAKHETEETIYTLDGRIASRTDALKSGIYVKNHQKMIVR